MPFWNQGWQPLTYSDIQAVEKLSQFAIVKQFAIAPFSPELADLVSEQYSSWPQHSPSSTSPELFHWLAIIWKSDTKYLSDLTQICNHWAYQNIIKMGKPVIPLLLRELETSPHYWFSALRKITGENPVPPEARGKLRNMASAWLEWGKRNGISW